MFFITSFPVTCACISLYYYYCCCCYRCYYCYIHVVNMFRCCCSRLAVLNLLPSRLQIKWEKYYPCIDGVDKAFLYIKRLPAEPDTLIEPGGFTIDPKFLDADSPLNGSIHLSEQRVSHKYSCSNVTYKCSITTYTGEEHAYSMYIYWAETNVTLIGKHRGSCVCSVLADCVYKQR